MKINIIGGTGYVGTQLATEAVKRGHEVTSFSRSAPKVPVSGVIYETGSVQDPAYQEQAVSGADAIVISLSARGELVGKTVGVIDALARVTDGTSVRFGVVGGAGSLLVTEQGPKVADADWFPADFRPEAAEMEAVLSELRAFPDSLDWFYISPPSGFGSWNPGVRTGNYRVGGELLLTDADGNANLSSEDLAVAVLDELEQPAHQRVRFSVAY